MKIVNLTSEELEEEVYIKYIKYLNVKMNNSLPFTLVFVNNEYIHKLNLEFRDKDAPTDVLTFTEDSKTYLGDVIISIDKVYEQSRAYNHSFKREIHFLITHGFLHLLGYDHIEKEDELEMFELQDELLKQYDIGR